MADNAEIRANLVEIFKRTTPVNKEDNKEVYWNGYNNLYPNEIEGVIANSPTAKRSCELLSKFIAGQGVINSEGELIPYESLPVINSKKGYKITDIIRLASKDIAKQSGVWLFRTFTLDDSLENVVPKSCDVLTYSKCRKFKEDADGNSGMIYFKDFEEKKGMRGKKKDVRKFYPFSNSQDVIKAQILNDAGKSDWSEISAEDIKKYKGQVMYLNLTPEYQYALSRFDAVYNDMDTEYRISLYANTQGRTGFLGKLIFITQGLGDMQKQIEEDLAEFMGAEDSGNMYHLNVSQVDDVTKVLHNVQLKAQFEDKLFELTEKRIRRNILGSANNIPEPLIYAGEGAMFGTQSDTYSEYKQFFDEQCRPEQDMLEQALTLFGFPCKIRPIVEEQVAQVSDKQADAQAALKGSVGGVTALIQLQQSVSQGLSTKAAAIAIVVEIYGIDEETAAKMIGDPVKTELDELQQPAQ